MSRDVLWLVMFSAYCSFRLGVKVILRRDVSVVSSYLEMDSSESIVNGKM